MTLFSNIRKLRAEKGWTQSDLANFSDVSVETIKRYENGKTNPTTDNLLKIANALNVNIKKLYSNNLFPTKSLSKDNLSLSESPTLQNSSVTPKAPKDIKKFDRNLLPDADFEGSISINVKKDTVYIPFFKDGAISAGFGTTDFENDCDFLPFKKQDLKLMFGVSNSQPIGIIPCIGNSMEPTIKEGELVVFQNDGSQTEGAIYVIRYDGELFVKRLQRRPLSLISDNKIYEPIKIEKLSQIELLGRVVGAYSILSKRF
ncbi:MAG: XRE family transcriptional regulator [Campylobacter sp.]|nr:XRE family transcriptional regulator [Campylobacter sp.]